MGKRSNFALSFWSFGFARERRIAKTEAPNPVQNAGYGGFAFVVVFETAYCALWLTPKFICFTPFIVSNVIVLMKKVRSSPRGTGPQLFIADQISEGAIAFLKTEYTYLVPFVVVCAAFIVGILEGQSDSPVSYLSLIHI